MKKRIVSILLAAIVSAVAVSGCAGQSDAPAPSAQKDAENVEEKDEDTQKEADASSDNEGKADSSETAATSNSSRTLFLGDVEETYYNKDLVPDIAPYTVEKDLANVVIPERFSYFFDSEYSDHGLKLRDALVKNNGFAVDPYYDNDEFFDVYEANRYIQFPNFVSVDSLMHTYHLYFSYLMKHAEKDYIYGQLQNLTSKLLEATAAQYKELQGTEWKEAALKNFEFFYIGSELLGQSPSAAINDAEFDRVVKEELQKIDDAQDVANCELTGLNLDYSQFKVRGYYEGDEILEKYFKGMMFYGQIPFALDNPEGVKSALLMSLAIDGVGKESWEKIYNVTSFFAGTSDDPGYMELTPIIQQVYGKTPSVKELVEESESFEKLTTALSALPKPAINSIPVWEGEDPVIPSFRFMGQRFTIDAAIMQRLVYSAVGENESGDRRYLPDALDTAAGLGSDKALEILEDEGATEFADYTKNLNEVKELFSGSNPESWNASLYAGWLNTLRPLLEKKGEGYPSFMQSDEWTKKTLETYAGSYAELKHDTILYAKQVMAEMGGGDDEEIIDDRGYVEPEPVVYSRFAFLSEKTREGLMASDMLSDEMGEDLDKLSTMAKTLLTISEKELTNENRTDEEYNFIREYGGYLEHFWYVTSKDLGENVVYSYEAPCPIVADIATDPNGAVLEVGTGRADAIFVVFPIDGELHIGRGSAYSFYQFVTSISDRLTDEEWRNRLSGGYLDDNFEWVVNENKPARPDWTMSYRVEE